MFSWWEKIVGYILMGYMCYILICMILGTFVKKKSKSSRSEYNHYQPNSPLTIHYITTGAILPEKDKKKNIKLKYKYLCDRSNR